MRSKNEMNLVTRLVDGDFQFMVQAACTDCLRLL